MLNGIPRLPKNVSNRAQLIAIQAQVQGCTGFHGLPKLETHKYFVTGLIALQIGVCTCLMSKQKSC